MFRENKNFGCSNRVEPFLDPSPNGRKESRSANDLEDLVSMHISEIRWLVTYKYSI